MSAALAAAALSTVNTQQVGVPGQALPEVPADAYGPDAVPLTPGGSELPAPDSDGGDCGEDKPEGVFPCEGCDREFTTARGRDSHSRQAHTADATEG